MSGATDGDYMLSGVGLIFLTMALLNTGCGAMNNGSCEINPEENKQ